MNSIVINRSGTKANCAFILGVLSMTNAVYLFTVGNSAILICTMFSILVLIMNMNETIKTIARLPCTFTLFILAIVLSVFQVLFFNYRYLSIWINGTGVFFIQISVLLAAMMLNDYQKHIFRGVRVGLIINLGFCLYEFFCFAQGSVFSIANCFPAINVQRGIIILRAGGLFAEPGHLMRAVSVLGIASFPYDSKKKSSKWWYGAFIAVISILTKSSSALIIFIGVVYYLCLKTRVEKRGKVKILLAVFLLLLFIFILILIVPLSNVADSVVVREIIDVFDKTNVSANVRRRGMALAIQILMKHPLFGCGWNTLAIEMRNAGFFSNRVLGSYSYAITLLSELGIGALIFYIYIVKMIHRLASGKETRDYALASALLVYMLETISTDFQFEPCNLLLLGVASARYRQIGNSIQPNRFAKRREMAMNTHDFHTQL